MNARATFDARGITGPFDIIGDVHGCADELECMFAKLGYEVVFAGAGSARSVEVTPPLARRAVFVGDLIDRGPRSPDVLLVVMTMVEAGQALCVTGNHDDKFRRWLEGHKITPSGGLAGTIQQIDQEPDASEFKRQALKFLAGLPDYLWLDGGRLVVSHAGIRAEMIGRTSAKIRSFCLYGDTTGDNDEYGFPVRRNWAAEYQGEAAVVYGHTPLIETGWLNRTLCLDTGCVYGNKLSALRWPEREIIEVPAAKAYAKRVKPLERLA